MDQNFSVRRRVFGDAAVGQANIRMVEVRDRARTRLVALSSYRPLTITFAARVFLDHRWPSLWAHQPSSQAAAVRL